VRHAAFALLVVVPLVSLQQKAGSFSFSDVAGSAGLNTKTVFGGEKAKRYIVETTGGGVAWTAGSTSFL
jgi:hypothetical protein